MAHGLRWKLVAAALASAALTLTLLQSDLRAPDIRASNLSPESPPISIDFRGCRILVVPPPRPPRVILGPLIPRGGASPEVQAEPVW